MGHDQQTVAMRVPRDEGHLLSPDGAETCSQEVRMDSPRIEIKTLGWESDHAAEKQEDADVTLYSRVFINGQELPGVSRVRVLAAANDFTTVMVRLIGVITVEPQTKEQWEALGRRI